MVFVVDTSMVKTRGFLVNLIFDPEYKGYVADVPQLPCCISQGKTVEAALKNVRKAIVVYLKVASEEAIHPIPEVLTSQVEVRMWRVWPESPGLKPSEPLSERGSWLARRREAMSP